MKKTLIHHCTKRLLAVALTIAMLVSLTACGGSSASIEGDLTELMDKLYETADVDEDTRQAFEGFFTDQITADNEQSILGSSDISYTEGVYSMPMISSIAYLCVLLRVEDGTANQVKETLQANADPDRWVCVSAETVLTESRGDLVLFIMCDQDTAYAISAAFQAL